MLRQKNHWLCCGYGDLFQCLRHIEKMGRMDLVLGKHYDVLGIASLLRTLVPLCEFRFNDNLNLRIDNMLSREVRNSVGRINCRKQLILSPGAISRIEPMISPDPYIVIHTTSIGEDRRYGGWAKLDLIDVVYRLVGSWTDPRPLPGELFVDDFLGVCKLLRGSRGLLSIDSCVMHLANAMGVPSVVVYKNRSHSISVPNCGERVYFQTDPDVIMQKVRDMICGAVRRTAPRL